MSNNINRRRFLKAAGVGSGFLVAGSLGSWAFFRPGDVRTKPNLNFIPEVEIALKATESEVPIRPGLPTRVWTFRAELRKGPPGVVQTLKNSYLGPVIRLHKGQKVRVYFTNELAEVSIVHWHGLHVPELADGHPRLVIPRGESYIYEFEVKNRAGTYWYHPHPHGRTGPQVCYGLAGLLLVSDEEEMAACLPEGDYDIPIVIQDRIFDENNQLVYLNRGMMDRMMGFLGDQILINGRINNEISVATRAYRLRLLNGSNSRIYKLAWSDGTPMTVIGSDGGLLGAPVRRPYLALGPAERAELWMDFSDRPIGTELGLKSLPFSIGMMSGMGRVMMDRGMMQDGMMNRSSLPNGAEFPVVKFRVDRQEKETKSLPEKLSQIAPPDINQAINEANPRAFHFAMQGMRWTINGRVFEMKDVAQDEIVDLNTTEVWEFVNNGGSGMMGGMMQMPHPVHVHGLQFRIVDYQVDNPSLADWDNLKDGFVLGGWKDTFLLLPGARAKVLLLLEDYEGLYLYHCHNLEHEDMGMMRNYLVRA